MRALKSLTLSGVTLNRLVQMNSAPNRELMVPGETSMDFLLPDNFLRIEDVQMSTTVCGISAGTPWTTVRKEHASWVADSFRRWLLLLTLSAPDVSLTRVGQGSPEEGSPDILLATGPNGFSARIALHRDTHLPLRLEYKNTGSLDPPPAPRHEIDVQLRTSDYALFDGIRFPRLIVYTGDGVVTRRFDVKKYVVNPPLKAKKFRPR